MRRYALGHAQRARQEEASANSAFGPACIGCEAYPTWLSLTQPPEPCPRPSNRLVDDVQPTRLNQERCALRDPQHTGPPACPASATGRAPLRLGAGVLGIWEAPTLRVGSERHRMMTAKHPQKIDPSGIGVAATSHDRVQPMTYRTARAPPVNLGLEDIEATSEPKT
jgi:hypothetical protein